MEPTNTSTPEPQESTDQQNQSSQEAPAQEAPAALELRAKAKTSLESITHEITAAEQAGPLTDEQVEAFAQRLAAEVQDPLNQASQLNAERRAFLASQMTAPGPHMTDHEGVVLTPGDLSHPADEQPHVGGRV